VTEPLRIVLISQQARTLSRLRSVCVIAGHTVSAYVSARSQRPNGAASPMHLAMAAQVIAEAPAGTDVLLPSSGRGIAQALAGCHPDLLVCSGFPWRLPSEVLRVPRLGAVNIHPSLLPRYRGPMPVHWAVRNGDPETGVTVHWMDEEFDTGPIIIQRGGVPLDDKIAPGRLWHQMDRLAADLLGLALERIADGCAGDPQDNSAASRFAQMGPEFLVVNWEQTVQEIHNQVRTFRLGLPFGRGPMAKVGDSWMIVLATRTEPGDGLRAECADGPIWIVDALPVAEPPSIERAPTDRAPSLGAPL
jgi:methionyl-tRNA formyltransferase